MCVCTIKHARCYFLLLLLLLLPNSRARRLQRWWWSPSSFARSRQRRFPARDDRAPPAENNKHQMLFLPVARIHRVFPRVRHFRRGVRVRRVRALLLLLRQKVIREQRGGASLSSSSSSRERGRRESAQSRDAGHIVFDTICLRKTMTKKKVSRFEREMVSIFSNRFEIDTFRVVVYVVVVRRERC